MIQGTNLFTKLFIMKQKINVLILSSTASAHNIIYSLVDNSEINLFVTDCNKYAYGLYEERITSFVIPRARDFENYYKTIVSIINEHKIDVIFPSSDHDMEGFCQIIESKPSLKVCYFNFSPVVFKRMNDKLNLSSALKTFSAANLPAEYCEKNISYPCVIKPTREGGSKDVKIFFSSENVTSYLSMIKEKYNDDYIIQEYIPGATGTMYVVLLLYNKEGELCESNVTRSLRTLFSWGGGGLSGETVKNPKLIQLADKIVSELGGWSGPINLEFKLYKDKFHLIEINCRLNGYSFINTMANKNYPLKMVNILMDKDIEYNPNKFTHKGFNTIRQEKIIESWKENHIY